MSINRVYNVMFHTHTISGIIISAALYVIFFTGSISFFKEEIQAWENNETSTKGDYFGQANFDSILKNIEKEHELKSKDVSIFYNSGQHAFVSLSESKDTLANKAKIEGAEKKGKKSGKSKERRPKRVFIKTDLVSNEFQSQERSYNLGEFFYRLHFFAQLNFYGVSGYIFAGFVSFFFLFAILTGVIVHWRKIIPSFYVFRPKEKWKTIWTDAHVSLGMIGLPFQFMFAVTGCYLIIAYSIMLPPVKSVLFNDDSEAFEKVVYANNNTEYDFKKDPLTKTVSYTAFVNQVTKKWPNLKLTRVQIFNFGDVNMHVKVTGQPKYNDKFLAGEGYITYRALDNKVVDQKDPYAASTSYVDGSSSILQRLHYGDYGGYGLKIIYFILGLVTCFVIISGVLIWLVARDKKNIPEYKRRFNIWLVRIYMAICLSMYPITAVTFIIVKCLNGYEIDKKTLIYSVFFWGWLVLSTLFIIKGDNYFTNKVSLISGSILGFLVPISNGIMTGNWPWVTWQKGYIQIFVMDVFWIVLSLTALAIVFKLKPKIEFVK